MNDKAKIAVFLSGGGSNLQSLIDATVSGKLDGEIVLVVSNKKNAYGLERARLAGIDTFVYIVKQYPSPEEAASDLSGMLSNYEVEYIALAGYLKLLPAEIVSQYKGKITNIHPALLPKYGGKGMYGHYVHEAVLANKETESGATIHLVDEIYDNGKILMQGRVPVLDDDTPETLAARVLVMEHKIYPEALDNLIKGKYR
ncbi:MAG: phosphoribosylglycinamide formyltransferase [Candidatus Zixiibacteriota bacterium]